jgi:type VI secretion system protein ImpH
MATASGTTDSAVIWLAVEDELRRNPWEYRFFQAVWLLERITGRMPVGEFAHPSREAVRFSAHQSLPFPASQIQGLKWEDGQAPVMTVNFMGLTGPSGVLPLRFTEFVIDRLRNKDRGLAAFFDIFNHRMISFFYRAWEKYRFPLDYQRRQADIFTRQLNALVGIGTPHLENRQEVADDSLRYYAGLLALKPRSAAALRDILMDYFGVDADVEQFIGSWRPLEGADQCCFDEGVSMSEQLGFGTVVGDAIWDQTARIRVRVGPLSRQRYESFLPGGEAYRPLEALLRFFVNDALDFEVQLVLRRQDVPSCSLGESEEEGAPRLGWVTWMKSVPQFPRDPADTILTFSTRG